MQTNVGNIFRYCETEPTELIQLMSAEYSRQKFGLAWPFCADADKISSKDHCRYWAARYLIGNRRVQVCSQWFERQRDGFSDYLASKRITPASGLSPDADNWPGPAIKRPNGRYGSTQIGDAQNAFIRVILSRLGDESFDAGDWEQTKVYFGHRCAYCDGGNADQMDHVVPINRNRLGEHRLGNVIPACKRCMVSLSRRDTAAAVMAWAGRWSGRNVGSRRTPAISI